VTESIKPLLFFDPVPIQILPKSGKSLDKLKFTTVKGVSRIGVLPVKPIYTDHFTKRYTVRLVVQIGWPFDVRTLVTVLRSIIFGASDDIHPKDDVKY